MKKIIVLILALLIFAPPVQAEELNQKLAGRILLQVEDSGQAWYVNPENYQRAFLGRPSDAFRIMRELGLGVSDSDYNLYKGIAPKKLAGKILLRVEARGEAYYVSPIDLKIYYLGRPSDAFRIMREQGLGISNNNLSKIVVLEKYKEVIQTEASAKSPEKRLLSESQGKINLYLFYGENCPHCIKVKKFLDSLAQDNENIVIHRYEVWNNKENGALFKNLKEKYNYKETGVPFLLIGEEKVYGYSSDETTGQKIKELINDQTIYGTKDIVFPLLNEAYYVEKVVDGDTIDVLIDGKTKRVRVIGVDTPEVVDPRQGVDCLGPESSDYAKKLLSNKYVRLEMDSSQDETDKYGRLLRHVLLDSGENFGELMIEKGLAKEYTYKVASKYQKYFILAETKAKKEKVGLWAIGACDNFVKSADRIEKSSTSSSLEIVNIFYNGNVGTLEPDEYVEIKNNGSVINLQGYSLNDEGGKKYVFPNFSLASNLNVKIFTGCGTNSKTELFWCNASSAIWNNTGDKAELKDASGKILATYSY